MFSKAPAALCVVMCLSVFELCVRAQVTVDQSLTIQEYVNDILLGEGVTATNISFIGSMEQFGYMTGGLDEGFPIEGGVILSSGNAADAFCANQGCVNCTGPIPTDADLLEIANDVPPLIDQAFAVGSVNDLCVIEFDFDPAGDFVSFNYIFGSKEYEAFENTQYNDIFAFFLSGAGITGQYNAPVGFPGQAINIATVPGSDPELPITISSVNGIINPEYYILNDNDDICMNGYTTVMTAVYPVICGETYHIKLAIGDGSDTILDSVVILEEGSFGSPIPTTYESQAAPQCDPDPDDDDVIYCAWEDCGPSTITISRPCAVSSLFPFNFDLIAAEGSEATLDEDLLGLPSSASIPVGEYSVSLTFEVPQDNIDEGTETLYLKVVSGSIEVEITIILFDMPPFESALQEEYIVPCDETAELCVELIQPPLYDYPQVEYSWSVNGVDFGEDSCLTYGSLTSSLVEVFLEDGCGREQHHQSFFTVPYEPLEINFSNDTMLCSGAELLLTLEVNGGQPPYQIQWDDFNDEDWVQLIDPVENTVYEVIVTDNCNSTVEDAALVWVLADSTSGCTSVTNDIVGCTYSFAENYNPLATVDDGSCILDDSGDSGCELVYDGNGDGSVGSSDLLGLLTEFGADCLTETAFSCSDPVSYQGYDYATVLIGEQCWFAENLRNENYENGDAIPSNLSDSDWQNTTSGAVAVYGEGSSDCSSSSPDGDACDEAWSLNEYGRLYNWYAVDDTRGLCPGGWHVPTDGEWTVMTDFLGGEFVAGGQMKTTYGWFAGGNATNSSGFLGSPGSYRNYFGGFSDAGRSGYWWSSSPSGSNAWLRDLYHDTEYVDRWNGNPSYGFSVRCIKDSE